MRTASSHDVIDFKCECGEMGTTARNWVKSSADGFAALNSLRFADAAEHWLIALPLASGDPWHAAAQTNAGTAFALCGDTHRAERSLRDAELSWAEHAQKLESAETDIPGRSSAFHFALASRNMAAFQSIHRRQLDRCCEAGRTIARFNRHVACEGRLPCADELNTLSTSLGDTLGPRAPAVRMLDAVSSIPNHCAPRDDSGYLDETATMALAEVPADDRPIDALTALKIAIGLTALLTPGLLQKARAARRSGSNAHFFFNSYAKPSST